MASLAPAVADLKPPRMQEGSQASRLWSYLHDLPAIEGRVYFAAKDVAPHIHGMTPTAVLAALNSWERTGNVHVIRETPHPGAQQRVRGLMSPTITQRGSQTDRVLQVVRTYADERGKVALGPEEIQRRAGLRDFHDVNKAFHNLRELGAVTFDTRSIGGKAERITNVRLNANPRVANQTTPPAPTEEENTVPAIEEQPVTVDATEESLRLHLGSMHALANWRTVAAPASIHEDEHNGPGTIRNHPREDWAVDISKAEAVEREGAELDEPLGDADETAERIEAEENEPATDAEPAEETAIEAPASELLPSFPLIASLVARAVKVAKVEQAARLLEEADMPDAALRVLEEGGSFNPLEAEVVRFMQEFGFDG